MSERETRTTPVEEETAATATRGSFVRATAEEQTLTGYSRRWLRRVRSGELGSLPIIVALIVIAVVFGVLNDTFLTERNFTNLLLQMSAVATLAIGIVFVLLIGEIDLSIAYVSGGWRSSRRSGSRR